MTGYVLEKIYYEHNAGPGHPESPERLKAVSEAIRDFKVLKKINARPASKDEICLIHAPAYFEKIKATQGHPFILLDPDTATSPRSFEAATYAAGGVIGLVDALFGRDINNGFAFVRPPGHHAEKDQAMGFCLFNNVAIGAAYAVKKYGLNRVAIIDLDLHHGNGTQHAFYETNRVLYLSIHQYPYYPGTGAFEEIGEGRGRGYNINLPIEPGADDGFYTLLLERIIIPILFQYQPEILFVSQGFDTYFKDPLGGMKVTAPGYRNMAAIIDQALQKICQGKEIYVLEGGYSSEGIRLGTREIINVLTGKGTQIRNIPMNKKFERYWQVARSKINGYWRI